MADESLDKRPVMIVGALAVAGAGLVFYLFPAPGKSDVPAFVPAPQAQPRVATEEPPATAEEEAEKPPFVEQERVRGEVTYDESTKSLSVRDPFGEELARIEVTNKTAVVGTSFDAEQRLVLVDYQDGRRVEVPETVWRAMPSNERDQLLYDDPALIPSAPDSKKTTR
jgi:hypothetical protein